MLPTIVGAVVILAIVTAAVLFGLNYLKNRETSPVANANTSANTANANPAVPAATPQPAVPDMASLKVEFSATTDPVSVTASLDGGRSESKLIAAGETATFEPKESLKLSYSRSLAEVVKLAINGRPITLPTTPANPRRSVIEFQIDKTTLPAIWASSSIGSEPPVESSAAGTPTAQPAVNTPAATATPKPETTAPATPAATPAASTRPANTAPTPSTAASPAKRPATGTRSPVPEATPARTPKRSGADTH